MSEKFFSVTLNMLKDKQMSISSISRELKTKGYDIHRLIITGYLRALYDTGYLEEEEIPPSKVYRYNHKRQEKDIYKLLVDPLNDIDSEYKFPVSVYVLTTLFNRPCFRYELNLVGVTPKNSTSVRESRSERLKEFREGISRFEIPPGDKAFEMTGNDENIISLGSEVIFSIMKDILDFTGLKSKYQSTQISQFIEKEKVN
jgi:DNA-binding transcriptional ArsR family regulator